MRIFTGMAYHNAKIPNIINVSCHLELFMPGP